MLYLIIFRMIDIAEKGRRLWARHRRDDARRRAETLEAAADSGHCRCGLTSADGGQLARAGQWPVPGRAGLLLYPAPPHNNIPWPELRTAEELVSQVAARGASVPPGALSLDEDGGGGVSTA